MPRNGSHRIYTKKNKDYGDKECMKSTRYFSFFVFALACQQGQDRTANSAQKTTRKTQTAKAVTAPKVTTKTLEEVCQEMGLGWELDHSVCSLKTPSLGIKDLCTLQKFSMEGEQCIEPAEEIKDGQELCTKFEAGATYNETSKKCLDSKNVAKTLKEVCVSFGDTWTFSADTTTCSSEKHLVPEKSLCNRLASTHVAWTYDRDSGICSASVSSIPQEKLCSYLESGWNYDSSSEHCVYGK